MTIIKIYTCASILCIAASATHATYNNYCANYAKRNPEHETSPLLGSTQQEARVENHERTFDPYEFL